MPAAAGGAWRSAPERPQLSCGAVHVWRADLTSLSDDLAELLSPDEHVRAQRMPRERDGRLWARGRGALRALLGRYLSCDPRALRFAYERHGKPVLAHDARRPSAGAPPAEPKTARLHFNMSHSQRLALYAFTEAGPVGVDVQVARRAIDEVALAARAFGLAESRRLEGLDPARRGQEFLRAWVRHEARLKCRGSGIGGTPAGASGTELWSAQLEVGSGAAAAVAADQPPSELRCWDWEASSRQW
jgi:4'-phosphopantetheinyl transferase